MTRTGIEGWRRALGLNGSILPGFDAAAPPSLAEPLYDAMVMHLRATLAVPVETGRFGADMAVSLVNDGPVTLLLEK